MITAVLTDMIVILSFAILWIADRRKWVFKGKAYFIYSGFLMCSALCVIMNTLGGPGCMEMNQNKVFKILRICGMMVWGLLLAAVLLMKSSMADEELVREKLPEKKGVSMAMIDTHFFFATLTAVVNLCERDPKAAKQMTLDFTKFIRTKMDFVSKQQPVAFTQELEHAQTYLSIQQARFKSRVKVEYDLQTMQFKLPPLTLQPLVENAVKHGLTVKADGGTVTISSREDAHTYRLEVSDDGAGFDTASLKTAGSTIVEIKQKLHTMMNGTMEISSRGGAGTSVVISIPKEKV